jgi:DnaK suppressor protein
MAKRDLEAQRQQLLDLRARLHGDIAQMASSALSEDRNKVNRMPTDLAELGSDNFAQEMTLNLLGSEKDVLDQIQAALNRIDVGAYGLCEECGKEIPKARLEAIPYAALCVHCSSQREREQEDEQ